MHSEVRLDLDPFPLVLERAADLYHSDIRDSVDLARYPRPCGMALAINRLQIRRLAAGWSAADGGRLWDSKEIESFIPDEIERMRTDGTFDGWPRDALERMLAGCGSRHCRACCDLGGSRGRDE